MSDNKLVHLAGGQGLASLGSSRLTRLKPATLTINQRMTRAEGSIPGKFRIVENGMQFDDLTVVLASLPVEGRNFYIGEDKSPDTLMCFSRDMVSPHPDAKEPQAAFCNGCPNSDWSKYNQTKNKKDIPKCDAQYVATFIDTEYQLPIRMYIRGASKAPFEIGMQEITRRLYMMQAKGVNPNIYDIKFKLSSVPGKMNNFVLRLSDFGPVTPEERTLFGSIYQSVVERPAAKAEEETSTTSTDQSIDAEVVSDTDTAIDGDVVEI